MRFSIKFVLLLFVFFQFAPSVITLLDSEREDNYSYFFQDEDEEESKTNKEMKEVKSEFLLEESHFVISPFITLSNENTPEYILKEYSISKSTFLLPPEQV